MKIESRNTLKATLTSPVAVALAAIACITCGLWALQVHHKKQVRADWAESHPRFTSVQVGLGRARYVELMDGKTEVAEFAVKPLAHIITDHRPPKGAPAVVADFDTVGGRHILWAKSFVLTDRVIHPGGSPQGG
jgi:hypothetical protein